MVERDVARRPGPLQLLGLEHRRRGADGAYRQRKHSHHSRGHYEPSAFVARLQPIRTKPSHIGSDGGPHAAVPSRVLPGQRLRGNQMVVSDEIHTHNTRVPRLHLQHHSHRCRQVRICISQTSQRSTKHLHCTVNQ